MIALVGSSDEKHLLVLFQNPAEIRPGGGFIGSYADLTVQNGQLQTMDVRDIYDPDGQFVRKVVPPWPLQTVTQDWGARDANWFFDFPTSARTVGNFLETSKIYSEKNQTFDAVIAININVLQSVLSLTGPISLPDYKLTIDKNNFLLEIQREVEAGADKAAGAPKKILKTLTPLLLQKFEALDSGAKKDFVEKLKEHFAAKDIMIYAKDPTLAGFLGTYNADGAVLSLPSDFWGTYVALVDANVAGGKSDAFVTQSLTGEIDVDTDGGSFVDLTVTRAHTGDKETDPWWKATNNDFLQVLTNPGAKLAGVKGADTKSVVSTFNYQAAKYEENPDLLAIESTKAFVQSMKTWVMSAFGKTDFATWLMTPAGGVKTLEVRYQISPTNAVIPVDGTVYKFIFEKQSGVQTALTFDIVAPFGYKWAESSDATYHFANPDPEKRVVVSLTLKKTDQ